MTLNQPLMDWQRFSDHLDAFDADGLLVSSPENVTYVSEFWGLGHWARGAPPVYAAAFRHDERHVSLVVPRGSADLLVNAVPPPAAVDVYGDFVCHVGTSLPESDAEALFLRALSERGAGTPASALKGVLERHVSDGAKRLAVENLDRFPWLHSLVPNLRLFDATPLLRSLRAVKSTREQRLLRSAAMITERALAETIRSARAGDSELDLKRLFHRSLIDQDATPQFTVVGTGPRTALPSAQPTRRRIGPGELIRFDAGCRFGYYVSDIARMAVAGKPTGEQSRLFNALWEGVEAGAKALRPGASGADVYWAAVHAVRAAGIEDYDRTHCGHGIGIASYDLPRITPDSSDVIEAGMVICLETPFYRIGDLGLQVEDTFVVTEDGNDRVTRTAPNMTALGT